jgi:dTDP-4-dehydrorhamnose 3,5-epimerase
MAAERRSSRGRSGVKANSRRAMRVERLPLAGALSLVPQAFGDERGIFTELYSEQRYRESGIDATFVQDNLSVSRRRVLRGLHGARGMAKLVQVIAGRAFDVIVDARAGSATFRQWYGVELDAKDRRQIYIPEGFLHGFLSLEDGTTLLYKQSALYDPAAEIGVAWDDPSLGITWPLEGAAPILSPKDAANGRLE